VPEFCFVLAERQNDFFHELTAAIRHELEQKGVATSLCIGDFPEATPDRVFVLVPPHEYYRLRGIASEPNWQVLKRTIFVCAEQPGSSFFDDDVFLADRAGAVFDISQLSIREFARRGVSGVRHLPLGWSPVWGHSDFETDPTGGAGERDVDVLHMGIFSPKRARNLAASGRWFWPHDTCFVLGDDDIPNAQQQANYFMGGRKWDLLRRSRVLVNLHVADRPYFEWLRIVQAIGCGCAVVSERSIDYEPLAPGEHLLFGAAESVMLMAKELVDDEPARLEMARKAWNFLHDERPMSRSVDALIEAGEEVNRNPLPREGRSTRFRVPAAATHPPSEEPQAYPSVVTNAQSSAIRAGLKDVRLDLLALRRGLATDRLARQRGTPPPKVEIAGQSAAYLAARPRASFVTALYNHAEHIGAALDSAAASKSYDIELIVTDDGSGDGSGDAVRDWMESQPGVPTLLLKHPVNRGLGAARNTAVDFARGEFIFILDADNEVFPTTLQKLVPTLESDPAAIFAYGMLEMFSRWGPVGLRSYYPWRPERFRQGNFIDAMALIRRDWVVATGGYTSDPRLHGWEDYDLWCRVAEHGGYGIMVPQITGRYRSSIFSMLSLTDISSRQAVAVLAERHPKLFTGVTAPL
jgi:hypothetical protein